jgi:hypothetical protein
LHHCAEARQHFDKYLRLNSALSTLRDSDAYVAGVVRDRDSCK